MISMKEVERERDAVAAAERALDAAKVKKLETAADVNHVAAARLALAPDEKAISAHLDREKVVAAKLEIAARQVAQAEAALAGTKAALASTEAQFTHDAYTERSEALATKLRGEYEKHAAAIAAIFSEVKKLNDALYGYNMSLMRDPDKSALQVTTPTTRVAMADFDKAFLPGFDRSHIWPL